MDLLTRGERISDRLLPARLIAQARSVGNSPDTAPKPGEASVAPARLRSVPETLLRPQLDEEDTSVWQRFVQLARAFGLRVRGVSECRRDGQGAEDRWVPADAPRRLVAARRHGGVHGGTKRRSLPTDRGRVHHGPLCVQANVFFVSWSDGVEEREAKEWAPRCAALALAHAVTRAVRREAAEPLDAVALMDQLRAGAALDGLAILQFVRRQAVGGCGGGVQGLVAAPRCVRVQQAALAPPAAPKKQPERSHVITAHPMLLAAAIGCEEMLDQAVPVRARRALQRMVAGRNFG